MSEGPEVRIIADLLYQSASNQVIQDIIHKKLSAELRNKILGATIEEVKTFGKNIVIKFSSGVYLRNHMMLWGKWRIYDKKDFDNGLAIPPTRYSYYGKTRVKTNHEILMQKESQDVRSDNRVRLILSTAEKVLIEFNGPIIEFSMDDPSHRAPISLLGPDALNQHYDKDRVVSNLFSKSKKHLNLLISDGLLDQQILSGIGNKYKSEILFLTEINPFKKVSSLSSGEIHKLVSSIPNVLNTGYTNNGCTRLPTTNHKKGSRDKKYWVFRRSGKECWKCGTKIVSERKMTQRQTFWCPTCQAL